MILGPSLPESLGAILRAFLVVWVLLDLLLIPGMVESCNRSPLMQPPMVQPPIDRKHAQPQAARASAFGEVEDEDQVMPPPVPAMSVLEQSRSNTKPESSTSETTERLFDVLEPSKRYDIEYADVDGVFTSRTIDVREVSIQPWATYITAWCHTRRSERTFRTDRILSARQVGSTTSIRDIEQHFRAYVPEEDLPDPDHDAVMSRVKSDLGILVWIAMADREITVDEEAILMDFIEERNCLAGARFADVPWSKNKASVLIHTLRPTFNTAMGKLGKTSQTGRVYHLLKRYAERLAEEGGQSAQKRVKQLFRESTYH